VEDFNTPLSPTDRRSRQESNKETSKLNDTTEQIDLTDIYRVVHSAFAQYTFSAAYGIFSKIDHF
jgi:hypothetical protein